jgi:predicted kinase
MIKKQTTKKVILFIGNSGSGKTTYIENNYKNNEYTIINPDSFLEKHPDYEPLNPAPLHNWSKAQANNAFYNAIAENKHIIYDSTGTDTDSMYKKIVELKKFNYRIKLIYVKVKLETAIKRNSTRARQVPLEILIKKNEMLDYSFELLKDKVNIATIINND